MTAVLLQAHEVDFGLHIVNNEVLPQDDVCCRTWSTRK